MASASAADRPRLCARSKRYSPKARYKPTSGVGEFRREPKWRRTVTASPRAMGPVNAWFGSIVNAFSRLASTNGRNARRTLARSTPASSISAAAASIRPTAQLLAITAAAWYSGNRSSATLRTLHRSAAATRSHQARAGPSPHTPTNDPGSRSAPASGDGNVCNGWNMAQGIPRSLKGSKLGGPKAPLV